MTGVVANPYFSDWFGIISIVMASETVLSADLVIGVAIACVMTFGLIDILSSGVVAWGSACSLAGIGTAAFRMVSIAIGD